MKSYSARRNALYDDITKRKLTSWKMAQSTATGEDTYVLCEINVSSCFAIPDQAPVVPRRASVGNPLSGFARFPFRTGRRTRS